MGKFQEFAHAVAEADSLIRSAPLNNSASLPDDDLLKRIKDKLQEALSLHGDAAKDVQARAQGLEVASDDETAHLALSAPQTPPDAAAVPGDINNPGPEPGSAPDVAQFGDDPEPAEDAKSSSRSSNKK